MPITNYIARATRARTAFKIEVRFTGGLNATQIKAFQRAADRWSRVIVGKLPVVQVDGEEIDGLLILAEGRHLDGPDEVLGESGPTLLRPKSAGSQAYLPAKGEMTFDTADLTALQREGTLADVIAHEMGHVLGIGTIWARKRLLVGATSHNPTFRGRRARSEYGKLLGTKPQSVPVENLGGKGTRNSHWRESVFGSELMSGFVASAPNPLSAVTVASLADLGYTVDLAQAEAYALPGTSPDSASAKTSSVAYRVLHGLRRPTLMILDDTRSSTV